MSASTNPDRNYVNRQHRVKLRLDQEEALAVPQNVSLPGVGATLMNISVGGCCLKMLRSELPFDVRPDQHLPSIKLLHPELDSTPIKGRVAWSREDPPYLLVGIQFTHIRSATLASIQTHVETSRE